MTTVIFLITKANFPAVTMWLEGNTLISCEKKSINQWFKFCQMCKLSDYYWGEKNLVILGNLSCYNQN